MYGLWISSHYLTYPGVGRDDKCELATADHAEPELEELPLVHREGEDSGAELGEDDSEVDEGVTDDLPRAHVLDRHLKADGAREEQAHEPLRRAKEAAGG